MQPVSSIKVGVALLIANERYRNTLRMYLEMQPGSGYQVVETADASVAVMDFDDAAARREWRQLRAQHADLAVICMSYTDKVPEGLLYLAKPVNGPELLAALAKVVARFPSRAGATVVRTSRDNAPETDGKVLAAALAAEPGSAGGSTPESSPDMAEELRQSAGAMHHARNQQTRSAAQLIDRRAHWREYPAWGTAGGQSFEPDLLYISVAERTLREVLADGRTRLIDSELQRREPVVCCAEHGGTVRTLVTDGVLRAACLVSSAQQGLTTRMGDPAELAAIGGSTISAEAFLWKIALWSARGRRPAGIGDEERVALRRWPNLTRVVPTSGATRIAALWASGTYSLSDTASTLGMDLATVYSCYYAMRVCGLLATPQDDVSPTTRGEVSAAPVVSAIQAQRRGLFSRIVKHLLG